MNVNVSESDECEYHLGLDYKFIDDEALVAETRASIHLFGLMKMIIVLFFDTYNRHNHLINARVGKPSDE